MTTRLEKEIARARQLEASHLWRRAARQWLTVLDITPHTQEKLRDALAARRAHCITYGNLFCGDYSGIREARLIDMAEGSVV